MLFLYEPVDTLVMDHLAEFSGKKLIAGDRKDLDLGDLPTEAIVGDPLPEKTLTPLCTWMQETLGERVEKVAVGKRLINSPAVALANDFVSPAMQRMMQQAMDASSTPRIPAATLEINPRHTLIKNLAVLREADPERAQMALEQLFDNTLVAAGLLEDAKPMLPRLYKMLENLTAVPSTSKTAS